MTVTDANRDAHASALFTREKAKAVQRAIVTNMVALRERQDAYAVGESWKPLRGCTAYVCGAGPSLSRALPLVPSMRRTGVVFAVNASAKAVHEAGGIDVLVARESVNVAEHMRPAGLTVLDLAANPAVWEATSSRRAWFVAGAVQNFALSLALQVRPLFAGTSAANAAVALALEWGAEEIVLVGSDLAFARDGAGYAPESAYGLVTGVETAGMIKISGTDVIDRVTEASGQTAPPKVQEYVKREGYGGGHEVACLWTWDDQRKWLALQAERHGRRVEVVNATGAGVRIGGWEEETVEAGMGRRSELHASGARDALHNARMPLRANLPAAFALLERNARDVLEAAGAADGDAVTPKRTTGLLVEAMAAGDCIRARRPELAPRDQILGTYGAFREAAEWTLKTIGP